MALDAGVLAELESIVGREHVRHREGEVAPYARDATPLFSSPPDAVVFPARTEEVAAVLRLSDPRLAGPGAGLGRDWHRLVMDPVSLHPLD